MQQETKTEEHRKKQQDKNNKKIRRLSFLVNNKIKTDTELLAKAFEQKEAGKKDLANFLISRTPKSLQDLIVTTWKMQDAVAQVQPNKTTRMEYTHTYIYTSERFQVELICLLAAPYSKVFPFHVKNISYIIHKHV